MEFRITITGGDALLMHNARLANPLDPATKALKRVTGKRAKTDDDHLEIARLEHAGSMYLDPDAGPYLPADNIWRCLYDGSRKHKMGPKVKEGVLITTVVNPVSYRGPRDAEGLWADENFRHYGSVKVGMSRTLRCRPIFRDWRVEADGLIDTNVLDFAELCQIAETARPSGTPNATGNVNCWPGSTSTVAIPTPFAESYTSSNCWPPPVACVDTPIALTAALVPLARVTSNRSIRAARPDAPGLGVYGVGTPTVTVTPLTVTG